jgi:phosphoglycerate dehydrogenase-like enzyme
MAEHVLALMLALSRDFPAMFRDQQQDAGAARRGQRLPCGSRRELLVVGLGGIGTGCKRRTPSACA